VRRAVGEYCPVDEFFYVPNASHPGQGQGDKAHSDTRFVTVAHQCCEGLLFLYEMPIH